MKSAFAAIIGRPSAGKSTLLNALCGEKVSITASVPQTTRNKIRGILTEERGQLVFLDTPGYHNSDRKYNNYMMGVVSSSLEESELVVYVVDSTRPMGKEEQELIDMLTASGKPLVVVLNKCDSNSQYKKDIRAFLMVNIHPESIIETSALKKEGIDELKEAIFKAAPEGPPMYPDDFYTDQEPEFRIAEIIREKTISKLSQEIPHATYVEISDMEMKGEGDKQKLWVRAFVTVEKESQKGMVIGKGGDQIKQIRREAVSELNRIFPYKIQLDLRVKVNPKWRTKDYLLKGLIK
ncbi:MAG: GTPase Era [Spirochaetales bacterium]|nr:GTPase Era [Spirochaetales bacterium]